MENDKKFMKDLKEGYDKIQKGKLWELGKMAKLYIISIPLPSSIASLTYDTLSDVLYIKMNNNLNFL